MHIISDSILIIHIVHISIIHDKSFQSIVIKRNSIRHVVITAIVTSVPGTPPPTPLGSPPTTPGGSPPDDTGVDGSDAVDANHVCTRIAFVSCMYKV